MVHLDKLQAEDDGFLETEDGGLVLLESSSFDGDADGRWQPATASGGWAVPIATGRWREPDPDGGWSD